MTTNTTNTRKEAARAARKADRIESLTAQIARCDAILVALAESDEAARADIARASTIRCKRGMTDAEKAATRAARDAIREPARVTIARNAARRDEVDRERAEAAAVLTSLTSDLAAICRDYETARADGRKSAAAAAEAALYQSFRAATYCAVRARYIPDAGEVTSKEAKQAARAIAYMAKNASGMTRDAIRKAAPADLPAALVDAMAHEAAAADLPADFAVVDGNKNGGAAEMHRVLMAEFSRRVDAYEPMTTADSLTQAAAEAIWTAYREGSASSELFLVGMHAVWDAMDAERSAGERKLRAVYEARDGGIYYKGHAANYAHVRHVSLDAIVNYTDIQTSPSPFAGTDRPTEGRAIDRCDRAAEDAIIARFIRDALPLAAKNARDALVAVMHNVSIRDLAKSTGRNEATLRRALDKFGRKIARLDSEDGGRRYSDYIDFLDICRARNAAW